MITDSFDNSSNAIINPKRKKDLVNCDICIASFSNKIERFLIDNYNPQKVGNFKCVNGVYPIYLFKYKNKKIGFYKTLLGAPASVGVLEEVSAILDTKKFLVFGSAGSLDKNICNNKIVVPTYAYRDEGTSYHYAKAEDYIKIKNSAIVTSLMAKNKIPFVEGKVWTTDAFYRETKNNFNKRKSEGCIAVDMECSAMQAVCNFRNLELFYFLVSGDILDDLKWGDSELHSANHNFNNFEIALRLASEL